MTEHSQTTLLWDWGTAYELFISLAVLHDPDLYGIRPSWAAGIRSRIPATERKFLEETLAFTPLPVAWISRLPAPKDAISALWALRQIDPSKRTANLFGGKMEDAEYAALTRIAETGHWSEEDLQALAGKMCKEKPGHKPEDLRKFLMWWQDQQKFGEMYLQAIQAYFQAFFENEEKRIGPILKSGLEYAQTLAEKLPLPDLIAELSQGVHIEDVKTPEVVLAPAYWTTPLLLFTWAGPQRQVLFFGARPASMSAIPGELVPDGLLRTLKALADPTRLKILNYLSQEELTPSELARRLNLRAPTVTHHLSELRLSGLVNLTLRGQEKFYRSRLEALESTFYTLSTFLQNTSQEK